MLYIEQQSPNKVNYNNFFYYHIILVVFDLILFAYSMEIVVPYVMLCSETTHRNIFFCFVEVAPLLAL